MANASSKDLIFQLRNNRRLVFNVLILNIAYLCFGYDASVISVILAMPAFIRQFGNLQPDGTYLLTATQTSVITATRTSASVPAIFVCGYLGAKWGRRNTCWLGCVTCLLGTALQTGASDIAEITVGLTIANFGYFVMVSMASTLAIEIAPVSVRGVVGSLSVVGTGLASILSSGIGWGTNTYASSFSYRMPVGLQNLWPLILSGLLFFVMDSPTTYLINGDDSGAEKSLRLVRGGYTDADILAELEVLKLQAQLRRDEDKVRWIEIFKGVNLRRTLLACFLGVIQQFSGSIYAAAYATVFLSQIGSANPFLLVFALNLLIFAGSIAGLGLIYKMRRRSILLFSFAVLFAIDVTIGGLGFGNKANPAIIKGISALCLLFGFFFSMTMGPLTWLNAAELPTARLRTVTNAFVLLCISLSNLAVTYVLPYITNADAGDLGAKTYLIFAGFMLAGLGITFLFFPDTKGRNAAELDRMFDEKLSSREFSSWQSSLTIEDVKAWKGHSVDDDDDEEKGAEPMVEEVA